MKPYYDEGGVTIYHGDCREVLPTLSGEFAVVTDPPYGVSYRQPRKCNARQSIVGDEAWSFERPGVEFVVWGANNCSDFSDCGWLVWDKARYGEDLFGDGELAATSAIRGIRIFRNSWNRSARLGYTGLHPTGKPVELMVWSIGFTRSAVVVDPYCGSGSTLVAASRLGRRSIGIEIEERYCEIAAKRLAQAALPLW